jgi:hypothetical protein
VNCGSAGVIVKKMYAQRNEKEIKDKKRRAKACCIVKALD